MTTDAGSEGEKNFPLAARLLGQIGKRDAAGAGGGAPAARPQKNDKPFPMPTAGAKQPGLSDLADQLLAKANQGGDPPGYDLLNDVRKRKILRRGFEIDAVKVLQRLLVDLGYECPKHGRFDFDTELAVRRFQRASGCVETAKVDETTLDALDRALGLSPRRRYGSKQ
jgi:hypothetical protein